MCICVRVWYICVFMCIHVCVCTWLHVWTYWYAHICVCIGVCVFPIFIWHFNPSSIFLYIIYIAHCAIILLCTLMLYICDRSTPDLNKDDELMNFNLTFEAETKSPTFCRGHFKCIFFNMGVMLLSNNEIMFKKKLGVWSMNGCPVASEEILMFCMKHVA